MNKKLIAIAATGVALSAGLGISAAALAAEELSEITIQAGPVTNVVGHEYSTGAPIERVTVDYHVGYADLDLIKHADVLALNKRVEIAAEGACQQLDELYPIERPKLHECMTDAVHRASEQVQKAIASAQSRPSN